MIIIRSQHDTQTTYLFYWSNCIIEEAELRGFTVDKIEDKEIEERILRKRIKHRKPSIIFFNGHGDASSLHGVKGEFINKESADVFRDTITFARACDSLKELGPEAVKKGCNAFIGYKNKFWIAKFHYAECKPLEDYLAKPILDASNTVMRELLKGKKVEVAIEKSQEHSARVFEDFLYSKDPAKKAAAAAVFNNFSALGFEGNSSASVNP